MTAHVDRSTVSAVVFDYGGVLTTPVRDSIATWLEQDRIDPESFSVVLKSWLSRSAPAGTPIHRLELGELAVADFDRLLAAELRTLDGSAVDPQGLLGRLFAAMRMEPAMLDLVRELRAAGVATALLSNSWGNTYPRQVIDELFDPVLISGELGLRKPDPVIFELVVERLGCRPEQVVFVDDAAPNLEGALRVGLATVEHTDPQSTRSRLAGLLEGPPDPHTPRHTPMHTEETL